MRAFGKYRLVEPIASGGMADVWRAEMTGAAGVVKEVALKLVRGEHAARSDFVRMFVEEARLASRLGHANVVQVFDFDEVDGRYYIAMELVRGRHLGHVADRARELGIRFGVPRALQVGVDVARGLAHAHRLTEAGRPAGVVHRDVSPHNVLVSFEGEVKLTDFGIARAMHRAGLSAPGTIKGKAAYMAPEQARGEPVDARADVFSLGVVLWELCTGRRLFARDGEVATLEAVRGAEPISVPSGWNEDVPPALDAALLGALERDPGRRTPTAQDLGAALQAVLLDVTATPEDVDLRAFMHRLFPAEIAAQHGAPPEPTRVRSVVLAAEPVAERTPPGRTPAELEPPTRTAHEDRARGGRARTLRIAGAVVAAGAVAVGVGIAIVGGTDSPSASTSTTPTSTPTSTATAISTPTPTSTATATEASLAAPHPPLPDAIPAAPAEDGREPAEPHVRPVQTAHGLNAIAIPPRSSGDGILSVNATPWGLVRVNGHAIGDTPQELRLPAGRHRVRIERKGHRAVDELVTVKAGARTKLLR